jgi:hypothetical protein
MLSFIGWLVLLVLCWPLALLRAILFLPARVLGHKPDAHD